MSALLIEPPALTRHTLIDFHEKVLPTIPWHCVSVPKARSNGKSGGLDRALWCLENFGASAVQWADDDQLAITLDPDSRWFAFGSTEQFFYFREHDDAVLFKVCRS